MSSMISLTMLIALTQAPAPAPDLFRFQDGDRIAMIGGTFIEREQKFGEWELALTLLNKDRKLSFRNLGWSGDTVWGESRNYFDANPKGYERLLNLTRELKPTVIMICYGQNESHAGKEGLKTFIEQYSKLLTDLAKDRSRIVVLTPPLYEDKAPLRDAADRNRNVKLYSSAIQELCQRQKVDCFDLAKSIENLPVRQKLTENGIHYGKDGYSLISLAFNPNQKLIQTENSDLLPSVARSDSEKELLEKIIVKNQLFFHRWRPQNETYLFGFRKHEQGRNAKEIVEFDPLIDTAEKEIDTLRSKLK